MRSNIFLYFSIFWSSWICSLPELSACSYLFVGETVLDVNACEDIDPLAKMTHWEKENEWLGNLNGDTLAKFKASYTGVLVKARVNSVTPSAQNKNYVGKTMSFFIPGKDVCTTKKGKRLNAHVEQICCNGSGNSPCLLETSYLIKKAEIRGKILNTPKDVLGEYIQTHPQIKKALNLLDQKKYEEAIASLKAESSDLYAKYLLAFALRNISSPEQALEPLEAWHKAYTSGTMSYDEMLVAKDALLLLAKCYALTRQEAKSIAILNIFLAKPKMFSREIRQADNAEEFNWIKASKEWKDYLKRREKIR